MEYDNATKDKIKNSDYYELLNKVREEAESLNGKKIIDYNSKRQSPSRTSPVRLSPVRDEKLQTRKVSPSRMLKKFRLQNLNSDLRQIDCSRNPRQLDFTQSLHQIDCNRGRRQISNLHSNLDIKKYHQGR